YGRNVESGAACAAIDQHGNPGHGSASAADKFNALVDAAASCHHILHHQHRLPGSESEAATEHENVVFLLGEDVARPGPACDFLADHEAAHRRGENRFKRETS